MRRGHDTFAQYHLSLYKKKKGKKKYKDFREFSHGCKITAEIAEVTQDRILRNFPHTWKQ